MMNDRELLELAAIAAGIQKSTMDNGCEFYIGVATDHAWNPLLHDGDAFRLAVNLKLDICFYDGYQEIHAGGDGVSSAMIEAYINDNLAATRRAIVRAAAEIGRAMP